MPKKEKKLSDSFLEIKRLRRTTDKSSLEKLRCLSAGGAKKRFMHHVLNLYILNRGKYNT